MGKEPILPPHGNYNELLSYQKAEIVYDVTYSAMVSSSATNSGGTALCCE